MSPLLPPDGDDVLIVTAWPLPLVPFAILVTRPWSLTVTLALVYAPATTPVVDNAKLIAPEDPPPVKPVPAVTPVIVPEPEPDPYP